MSRVASTGARPAAPKRLFLGPEDQCPICKTSRYANKDLTFHINPECYHPMCTNCVNRIFRDAPAQCPTAGCSKTLRHKGFHEAFFGDLAVEREVDIRRRVADVFNRTEDEFETLDAYNNYLQMVEDLTFNLINGTEAERNEAQATLELWRVEHKAEIERNMRAGLAASEETKRRYEADRKAIIARRAQAVREAQEEKLQRERDREEELEQLAKPPEARVQLKKRVNRGAAAKQPDEVDGMDWAAASADVGKLSLRGLKKEKKPTVAPQGPYDPFGGLNLTSSRYRVHDGLVNPWETDARLDSTILTGGYNFDDYTARVMFEAFAGLAVFVEDEKDDTPRVKHEQDVAVKVEVDT